MLLVLAQPSRAECRNLFDSMGRLWSFGGYDGAKLYDDASRFENGAWTPAVPAGPAARFRARLLDVGDKWLLQFGSTSDFDRSWKDFGDVWELAPR